MIVILIIAIISLLTFGVSQSLGLSGASVTPTSNNNVPVSCTVFSYSQLVSLAQSAGFSGNDALTAAAIAMAESGGDPNAYNPETAAGTPSGLGSYGLWQIYLKMHPEFSGDNLFDPPANANAAFSVWNRAGGFSPWSTFNSGTYAQYVQTIPGISA